MHSTQTNDAAPKLKTARTAMVRALAGTLAIALAANVLWLPGIAWAEVRKADVIAGMTVEQRDLAVAGCPSVDAEHAALMSSDGTIYFERAAQDQVQIASITKVMTAIVTLDCARDDTTVIVSAEAANIGESSANLQEGDSMDLLTALKAMLVPSGNDAALAIAETVGAQLVAEDPSLGDNPVKAFVAKMNEKAAQLGCTDTVYENPHGLDDGEYQGLLHSTACDQLKVAQCAMTYDVIRQIVGGGSTTVTVMRDGSKAEVELETTDELLEMYDNAIGIKTGTTDLAGPSFLGAASSNGLELYAVVLGSTDEYQRFADAKNLFIWAYDHVHVLELSNSDVVATIDDGSGPRDVEVIGEAPLADWQDKTVKAALSDPDATISVFDLEGNVSQSVTFDELHGTVRAGDKVGSIVFKQRNLVVAEQDLIACETVAGPNPIESISIWWHRLIGGNAAVAEPVVYNVMPTIYNYVSNAA